MRDMPTTHAKPLHPHSALIDELGGPYALARFFSIRPPSVCEWRHNGIPGNRLIDLYNKWPRAVKPHIKAK